MPNYKNLDNYVEYLKQFPKQKNIRLGNLFTYNYLFNNTEGFNDKLQTEYSKVKFYDFIPATLILGINIKNKSFYGINFHHLPVDDRDFWKDNIKNIFKNFVNDKGDIHIKVPYLDKIIKESIILKSIKKYEKPFIPYTNYRMENVRSARQIPFQNWDDVLNKYSDTLYGSTMDMVTDNRFKSFIE